MLIVWLIPNVVQFRAEPTVQQPIVFQLDSEFQRQPRSPQNSNNINLIKFLGEGNSIRTTTKIIIINSSAVGAPKISKGNYLNFAR